MPYRNVIQQRFDRDLHQFQRVVGQGQDGPSRLRRLGTISVIAVASGLYVNQAAVDLAQAILIRDPSNTLAANVVLSVAPVLVSILITYAALAECVGHFRGIRR